MGLLFDEHPLVLSPTLAIELGNLNEAVFVQQLHYWIEIKRETGKNFVDGCYWVFNTYEEWAKQFPWLSIPTLRRTIDSLVKKGYVIKGNYNQKKMDHTTWYTLNYEKIMEIDKKSKKQKDEQAKLALEAAKKEEEDKNLKTLIPQEVNRCDQNEQIDLSIPADRCDQNDQIDVIKMSRSMCSNPADRCDQNDQSNTIDYSLDYPKTTTTETTDESVRLTAAVEVAGIKTESEADAALNAAVVIDDYNKLCPSFPDALCLTPKRRELIRSLFSNGIRMPQIQEAFRRAEESDFLTGRVKGADWNRFDIDWILQPSNIVSLLEGKYDNVAVQKQKRIAQNEFLCAEAMKKIEQESRPSLAGDIEQYAPFLQKAIKDHSCHLNRDSEQEASS